MKSGGAGAGRTTNRLRRFWSGNNRIRLLLTLEFSRQRR
jgi:hypothetical protein